MSLLLLEQLENLGFLSGSKVNDRVIRNTKVSRLIEIVQESIDLTSERINTAEDSIFNCTASMPMAGGPFPCASFECRAKLALECAQFAALYSDKVFIYNHLASMTHRKTKTADEREEFVLRFIGDIGIVALFRPLIEGNIVSIIADPSGFCPICLLKEEFGVHAQHRFEDAYKTLMESLQQGLEFTVKGLDGGIQVRLKGSEQLIAHGELQFWRSNIPERVRKHDETMRKLMTGKSFIPTREIRSQIGTDHIIADDIINNAMFDVAISQSLRTTFLSDKDVYVEFLHSLSDSPHVEKRNATIAKHLTAVVPVVTDIEMTDLLKLRHDEGDAFTMFREGLNAAIQQATTGSEILDIDKAVQIKSDIIDPKLARLNQSVRAARKSLEKKAIRKALAWTGSIGFGTYFGFIPPDLAGAAGALGLTQIIADLAETGMKRGEAEDVIRTEDMYFLWKLTQLSK